VSTTLHIDGSQGEGGGQVLRSSLSLALCTGQPFVIENIRAGRKKPGLLRQHKTCVQAAAQIGCAQAEGAELGSRRLSFSPGAVVHGHYRFSVGSAGSAMLVLQTILPPLLVTEGRSVVVLEGGTHNPFAPPFDFLDRVFAPAIEKMGGRLGLKLERAGFFPAGGGRVVVDIEGGGLKPAGFVERSDVTVTARALVANLPFKVAERELKVVRSAFGLGRDAAVGEELKGPGPGNALLIEASFAEGRELVVGFGEKGLPAEKVAKRAVGELQQWIDSGVPVGRHLADQLMVPMALAGGGRFLTQSLSLHATTNLDVIQTFLPDLQVMRREEGERVRVIIGRGV
jgi:RNA 3'-terminal phosphate cyclase (ATP)